MSGTAPNDPAPGGGHASDRGVEQTRLDGNQHGQAQNIIDETKDTHGSKVDRDVGETIDATKSSKAGLSSRVDDLLSKTSSSSGETSGGGRKATSATEQGFRVGEEADLHGLASSKQP